MEIPIACTLTTSRGLNSPWLVARFQYQIRLTNAHTTRTTSHKSILTPCWFLLLPIVRCLSSPGTLLLTDAVAQVLRKSSRLFGRYSLSFSTRCMLSACFFSTSAPRDSVSSSSNAQRTLRSTLPCHCHLLIACCIASPLDDDPCR